MLSIFKLISRHEFSVNDFDCNSIAMQRLRSVTHAPVTRLLDGMAHIAKKGQDLMFTYAVADSFRLVRFRLFVRQLLSCITSWTQPQLLVTRAAF